MPKDKKSAKSDSKELDYGYGETGGTQREQTQRRPPRRNSVYIPANNKRGREPSEVEKNANEAATDDLLSGNMLNEYTSISESPTKKTKIGSRQPEEHETAKESWQKKENDRGGRGGEGSGFCKS